MKADDWREKRKAERAAEEAAKSATSDPVIDAAAEVAAQAEAEVEEIPVEELQAEPVVDEAIERRRLLLRGVPADVAAFITDDELLEIEQAERKRADQEAKKAALSLVRDQMRQQARAAAGLISHDELRSDVEQARMAEMVTFRINAPGGGAGHRGARGPRIDGEIFEQGHVYIRPRHVADSVREMLYRAHVNEIEFRTLDQASVFGRGEQARVRPAVILMGQNPLVFEVMSNA